jgi:hypothetical protein
VESSFECAKKLDAGNSLIAIRELKDWQSVFLPQERSGRSLYYFLPQERSGRSLYYFLLQERSGRSLYYRRKTVVGHVPAQRFAGDISVQVISAI